MQVSPGLLHKYIYISLNSSFIKGIQENVGLLMVNKNFDVFKGMLGTKQRFAELFI